MWRLLVKWCLSKNRDLPKMVVMNGRHLRVGISAQNVFCECVYVCDFCLCLVCFSTIDKPLKTTVMLFLCDFLLRFMTCTMKFWIKYGLAFEFDTARIMKFFRSLSLSHFLPAKLCFYSFLCINLVSFL